MIRAIRGHLAGVAFALAVIAAPALSGADESAQRDPSQRIQAARAALDDQRYEDAIKLVAPLTTEAPNGLRSAALEITAIAELILGRPNDARAPLAALYDLAPAFVIADPSLPPRVTSAFDAEAARPHARAVEVTIRAAWTTGTSFEIRAGGETSRVVLGCRAAHEGGFVAVPTQRRGDGFDFELPLARPHECYAVALDVDELPLGRVGTPLHPVEIAPHVILLPRRPRPSRVAPILIWTLAGAVVSVVSVSALYVATKPVEANKPKAQLDVIARPVGYAPSGRRWASFSW